MSERARRLGGELILSSRLSEGTLVRVEIPLNRPGESPSPEKNGAPSKHEEV